MNISFKNCYAIETSAECIVNSANGLLMYDSSGAGKIREASSELENKEEFEKKFNQIDSNIKAFITKKALDHKWHFKKANEVAVDLLLKKNAPFKPGDAILDNKSLNRPVINAITMSYNPKTSERIFGSINSVKKSYTKAIEIAIEAKYKSIALPLPVARTGYGIGPQKSYETVMSVLKQFKEVSIDVTICLDNSETQEYYKKEIKK